MVSLVFHKEYAFVKVEKDRTYVIHLWEFIGPIVKALQELEQKLKELEKRHESVPHLAVRSIFFGTAAFTRLTHRSTYNPSWEGSRKAPLAPAHKAGLHVQRTQYSL